MSQGPITAGVTHANVAHSRSSNRHRTRDVQLAEDGITFESLLLDATVIDGLNESGFSIPSPIQLKAIPLGRCGVDLIGQAKSGTGKTCVFSVIALEAITPTVDSRVLQAVIIAPTREIAVQIHEVICAIGCKTKISFGLFIGGISLKADIANAVGCQIAVGTPGRLLHLIQTEHLQPHSVRLLILDEADKLMDCGFRDEIDTIFNFLPDRKQILALSATYPQELADLLALYMRDPVHVRLGASAPSLEGVDQYHKEVKATTPHSLNAEKLTTLLALLSQLPFRQCVVFCNLRTKAQNVAAALCATGYPAGFITGGLTQLERNSVMHKLKEVEIRVLVSTDLTARGIDVEKVNLVVNLDPPDDPATYLHRIGRTGRFGTHGIAVTLVGTNEMTAFKVLLAQAHTATKRLPRNVDETMRDVTDPSEMEDTFTFEPTTDAQGNVVVLHPKVGLAQCKWEQGEFAKEGCWAHRKGKCLFMHRDELVQDEPVLDEVVLDKLEEPPHNNDKFKNKNKTNDRGNAKEDNNNPDGAKVNGKCDFTDEGKDKDTHTTTATTTVTATATHKNYSGSNDILATIAGARVQSDRDHFADINMSTEHNSELYSNSNTNDYSNNNTNSNTHTNTNNSNNKNSSNNHDDNNDNHAYNNNNHYNYYGHNNRHHDNNHTPNNHNYNNSNNHSVQSRRGNNATLTTNPTTSNNTSHTSHIGGSHDTPRGRENDTLQKQILRRVMGGVSKSVAGDSRSQTVSHTPRDTAYSTLRSSPSPYSQTPTSPYSQTRTFPYAHPSVSPYSHPPTSPFAHPPVSLTQVDASIYISSPRSYDRVPMYTPRATPRATPPNVEANTRHGGVHKGYQQAPTTTRTRTRAPPPPTPRTTRTPPPPTQIPRTPLPTTRTTHQRQSDVLTAFSRKPHLSDSHSQDHYHDGQVSHVHNYDHDNYHVNVDGQTRHNKLTHSHAYVAQLRREDSLYTPPRAYPYAHTTHTHSSSVGSEVDWQKRFETTMHRKWMSALARMNTT